MKFESYKNKIDIGDIIYVIVRAALVSLLGSVLIMMFFGYQFMIVSSGSMTPTLPVGSLVVVQPYDYDKLQEGDIVTMRRGGFYLTHRLYAKTTGKDYNGDWVLVPPTIMEDGVEVPNPDYDAAQWITKGDANNNVDEFRVYEEDVVGRVIFCFEPVGYIYRFVKYNTVYSIVVLLLIMLEIGVAGYIKDMVEVVDIEEDEED